MIPEIVSIGLPVYNAEKFLKDTIISILNQSYIHFELIIVDDGSTDNSIDIINSFNDKRIVLYEDGINKGLPTRLNQITTLAKGYYLARMDADDIMHPQRIEKQLKVLKHNKKIDVLGSNAYSLDEYNTIKGIRYKELDTQLTRVNSFIHPTVFAKTEWFRKNPYEINLLRYQDAELWFRTSLKYNFYILNTPLLFYREFGGKYYRKYFKGLNTGFKVGKQFLQQREFKNCIMWSYRFIFFKFFKAITFYVFYIFGYENYLISRRNIILDKKILNNSSKILNSCLLYKSHRSISSKSLL